ncbi:UNVERIFIED_CONTAM: hypothetical protein FKN15_022459 [Acipenser sinensis]
MSRAPWTLQELQTKTTETKKKLREKRKDSSSSLYLPVYVLYQSSSSLYLPVYVLYQSSSSLYLPVYVLYQSSSSLYLPVYVLYQSSSSLYLPVYVLYQSSSSLYLPVYVLYQSSSSLYLPVYVLYQSSSSLYLPVYVLYQSSSSLYLPVYVLYQSSSSLYLPVYVLYQSSSSLYLPVYVLYQSSSSLYLPVYVLYQSSSSLYLPVYVLYQSSSSLYLPVYVLYQSSSSLYLPVYVLYQSSSSLYLRVYVLYQSSSFLYLPVYVLYQSSSSLYLPVYVLYQSSSSLYLPVYVLYQSSSSLYLPVYVLYQSSSSLYLPVYVLYQSSSSLYLPVYVLYQSSSSLYLPVYVLYQSSSSLYLPVYVLYQSSSSLYLPVYVLYQSSSSLYLPVYVLYQSSSSLYLPVYVLYQSSSSLYLPVYVLYQSSSSLYLPVYVLYQSSSSLYLPVYVLYQSSSSLYLPVYVLYQSSSSLYLPVYVLYQSSSSLYLPVYVLYQSSSSLYLPVYVLYQSSSSLYLPVYVLYQSSSSLYLPVYVLYQSSSSLYLPVYVLYQSSSSLYLPVYVLYQSSSSLYLPVYVLYQSSSSLYLPVYVLYQSSSSLYLPVYVLYQSSSSLYLPVYVLYQSSSSLYLPVYVLYQSSSSLYLPVYVLYQSSSSLYLPVYVLYQSSSSLYLPVYVLYQSSSSLYLPVYVLYQSSSSLYLPVYVLYQSSSSLYLPVYVLYQSSSSLYLPVYVLYQSSSSLYLPVYVLYQSSSSLYLPVYVLYQSSSSLYLPVYVLYQSSSSLYLPVYVLYQSSSSLYLPVYVLYQSSSSLYLPVYVLYQSSSSLYLPVYVLYQSSSSLYLPVYVLYQSHITNNHQLPTYTGLRTVHPHQKQPSASYLHRAQDCTLASQTTISFLLTQGSGLYTRITNNHQLPTYTGLRTVHPHHKQPSASYLHRAQDCTPASQTTISFLLTQGSGLYTRITNNHQLPTYTGLRTVHSHHKQPSASYLHRAQDCTPASQTTISFLLTQGSGLYTRITNNHQLPTYTGLRTVHPHHKQPSASYLHRAQDCTPASQTTISFLLTQGSGLYTHITNNHQLPTYTGLRTVHPHHKQPSASYLHRAQDCTPASQTTISFLLTQGSGLYTRITNNHQLPTYTGLRTVHPHHKQPSASYLHRAQDCTLTSQTTISFLLTQGSGLYTRITNNHQLPTYTGLRTVHPHHKQPSASYLHRAQDCTPASQTTISFLLTQGSGLYTRITNNHQLPTYTGLRTVHPHHNQPSASYLHRAQDCTLTSQTTISFLLTQGSGLYTRITNNHQLPTYTGLRTVHPHHKQPSASYLHRAQDCTPASQTTISFLLTQGSGLYTRITNNHQLPTYTGLRTVHPHHNQPSASYLHRAQDCTLTSQTTISFLLTQGSGLYTRITNNHQLPTYTGLRTVHPHHKQPSASYLHRAQDCTPASQTTISFLLTQGSGLYTRITNNHQLPTYTGLRTVHSHHKQPSASYLHRAQDCTPASQTTISFLLTQGSGLYTRITNNHQLPTYTGLRTVHPHHKQPSASYLHRAQDCTPASQTTISFLLTQGSGLYTHITNNHQLPTYTGLRTVHPHHKQPSASYLHRAQDCTPASQTTISFLLTQGSGLYTRITNNHQLPTYTGLRTVHPHHKQPSASYLHRAQDCTLTSQTTISFLLTQGSGLYTRITNNHQLPTYTGLRTVHPHHKQPSASYLHRAQDCTPASQTTISFLLTQGSGLYTRITNNHQLPTYTGLRTVHSHHKQPSASYLHRAQDCTPASQTTISFLLTQGSGLYTRITNNHQLPTYTGLRTVHPHHKQPSASYLHRAQDCTPASQTTISFLLTQGSGLYTHITNNHQLPTYTGLRTVHPHHKQPSASYLHRAQDCTPASQTTISFLLTQGSGLYTRITNNHQLPTYTGLRTVHPHHKQPSASYLHRAQDCTLTSQTTISFLLTQGSGLYTRITNNHQLPTYTGLRTVHPHHKQPSASYLHRAQDCTPASQTTISFLLTQGSGLYTRITNNHQLPTYTGLRTVHSHHKQPSASYLHRAQDCTPASQTTISFLLTQGSGLYTRITNNHQLPTYTGLRTVHPHHKQPSASYLHRAQDCTPASQTTISFLLTQGSGLYTHITNNHQLPTYTGLRTVHPHHKQPSASYLHRAQDCTPASQTTISFLLTQGSGLYTRITNNHQLPTYTGLRTVHPHHKQPSASYLHRAQDCTLTSQTTISFLLTQGSGLYTRITNNHQLPTYTGLRTVHPHHKQPSASYLHRAQDCTPASQTTISFLLTQGSGLYTRITNNHQLPTYTGLRTVHSHHKQPSASYLHRAQDCTPASQTTISFLLTQGSGLYTRITNNHQLPTYTGLRTVHPHHKQPSASYLHRAQDCTPASQTTISFLLTQGSGLYTHITNNHQLPTYTGLRTVHPHHKQPSASYLHRAQDCTPASQTTISFLLTQGSGLYTRITNNHQLPTYTGLRTVHPHHKQPSASYLHRAQDCTLTSQTTISFLLTQGSGLYTRITNNHQLPTYTGLRTVHPHHKQPSASYLHRAQDCTPASQTTISFLLTQGSGLYTRITNNHQLPTYTGLRTVHSHHKQPSASYLHRAQDCTPASQTTISFLLTQGSGLYTRITNNHQLPTYTGLRTVHPHHKQPSASYLHRAQDCTPASQTTISFLLTQGSGLYTHITNNHQLPTYTGLRTVHPHHKQPSASYLHRAQDCTPASQTTISFLLTQGSGLYTRITNNHQLPTYTGLRTVHPHHKQPSASYLHRAQDCTLTSQTTISFLLTQGSGLYTRITNNHQLPTYTGLRTVHPHHKQPSASYLHRAQDCTPASQTTISFLLTQGSGLYTRITNNHQLPTYTGLRTVHSHHKQPSASYLHRAQDCTPASQTTISFLLTQGSGLYTRITNNHQLPTYTGLRTVHPHHKQPSASYLHRAQDCTPASQTTISFLLTQGSGLYTHITNNHQLPTYTGLRTVHPHHKQPSASYLHRAQDCTPASQTTISFLLTQGSGLYTRITNNHQLPTYTGLRTVHPHHKQPSASYLHRAQDCTLTSQTTISFLLTQGSGLYTRITNNHQLPTYTGLRTVHPHHKQPSASYLHRAQDCTPASQTTISFLLTQGSGLYTRITNNHQLPTYTGLRTVHSHHKQPSASYLHRAQDCTPASQTTISFLLTQGSGLYTRITNNHQLPTYTGLRTVHPHHKQPSASYLHRAQDCTPASQTTISFLLTQGSGLYTHITNNHQLPTYTGLRTVHPHHKQPSASYLHRAQDCTPASQTTISFLLTQGSGLYTRITNNHQLPTYTGLRTVHPHHKQPSASYLHRAQDCTLTSQTTISFLLTQGSGLYTRITNNHQLPTYTGLRTVHPHHKQPSASYLHRAQDCTPASQTTISFLLTQGSGLYTRITNNHQLPTYTGLRTVHSHHKQPSASYLHRAQDCTPASQTTISFLLTQGSGLYTRITNNHQLPTYTGLRTVHPHHKQPSASYLHRAQDCTPASQTTISFLLTQGSGHSMVSV